MLNGVGVVDAFSRNTYADRVGHVGGERRHVEGEESGADVGRIFLSC